jgi:hypothetical protein
VAEEVVPVLYTEDAGRAVAWYERLGFRKEWEHQFEPGLPWFVSVARGNVRLYLSEPKGDARPDTLIHLYVDDVDAVSEEFGVPVDEGVLQGESVSSKIPTATGCVWRLGAPDDTAGGHLEGRRTRCSRLYTGGGGAVEDPVGRSRRRRCRRR